MRNVLNDFKAIFQLAGIEVSKWHEIKNKYWPDRPEYDCVRTPWYLAQTEYGIIQIGWRKRVININWEETKTRAEVTSDDVTKDKTMVHAYTHHKAVEYMEVWAKLSSRREMTSSQDCMETIAAGRKLFNRASETLVFLENGKLVMCKLRDAKKEIVPCEYDFSGFTSFQECNGKDI